MQKISNIILYIAIGLLIIGGVALFFLRDGIIGGLQADINAENESVPVTISLSAKDTIDPEIVKDQRLAGLTNYVVNFNFDAICRRPDVVNKAATAATGTTPVAALECRLGSDFPFLVTKP